MQKVDYSDINKFLVSIGLFLITLSVLLPYLFLKDNFGLFINCEDIAKYPESVQTFILDKQILITQIQDVLPISSIVILVIGIITVAIGLTRWFKRQLKIDEKFDLEVAILNIEMENMTPAEKYEKAVNEEKEIKFEEQYESNTRNFLNNQTNGNTFIDNYMKIEEELYGLFKNLNHKNYLAYSNQKLGKKFLVDIILKSKSPKYSDLIIEVKYFRSKIFFAGYKNVLNSLNTYISYYKDKTNKNVNPVLLIVYKEDINKSEYIEDMKHRIFQFTQDIPNMNNLKLEFIDVNHLKEFNVNGLLNES